MKNIFGKVIDDSVYRGSIDEVIGKEKRLKADEAVADRWCMNKITPEQAKQIYGNIDTQSEDFLRRESAAINRLYDLHFRPKESTDPDDQVIHYERFEGSY